MIRKIIVFMLAAVLGFGAADSKKKKTEGKPAIEFEQTSWDFGNIPERGGNVSHDFYFTNTGDAPLVIVTVSASCGCTKPQFNEKPLAPGKREKVRITYNPKGRPGEFIKNAYVRTNAPDQKKVTIKIKGNVIPAAK